ncbi:uncharacterized protein LOC116194813 isoform X2 [Punica granatum]|uniref:Uncharacterized protein LOC116194813 isoform X2 n=1 Tax=Punica granatum TaxID=22663 RepID=A0A6P8CB07_PUNGR|nr:uncharacterized protein LOC116194813 isoform X2 [Punica granatum]
MRTPVPSASASASSSSASSSPPRSGPTPTATMKECPPSEEARDSSCYYPGCRKDANCSCEMCLASISATLDLMPSSSLTKLSACRPRGHKNTPVSFDPSILSTPTSFTRTNPQKLESPALRSTEKVPLCEMKEKKVKRDWRFEGKVLRWIFGLILILAVDFGISRWVSVTFRPKLSADLVRYIGEKSRVEDGLEVKLRLVQRALQAFVEDNVSNCSDANSNWQISQTAGLLTSGFSSRWFTVVTGRVTEWSGGNTGYKVRKANSLWVLRKWGASIVQLDRNTVILEYRRSSILDNHGIFSALSKLLKYHISGLAKRIKKKFWYLAASGVSGNKLRKLRKDGTDVPT